MAPQQMEQRGDSAQDAHQRARTSGNCCSSVDSWERVFAKLRGCFLCDNTSAMSAAVHGYARSPDLATLSNTLHLALAALKCTPFFEWVPSLANCADIPSRPQGVAEEAFYARVEVTRWPENMKFPSFANLQFPKLNSIFEQ